MSTKGILSAEVPPEDTDDAAGFDTARLGIALSVLGGGLAMVAAFAPWATGRFWLLATGASGLDLGDGMFVLLLGAFAVLAALLAPTARRARAGASGIILASGFGLAVVSIVDLILVRSAISEVTSWIDKTMSSAGDFGGPTTNPFSINGGAGLWLAVGASILCIAGGLILVFSSGPANIIKGKTPLFVGATVVIVALLVVGALTTGASFKVDWSLFGGNPEQQQQTANDKAAESGLRNSLAAAKTIFTDTDDYSEISVTMMTQVEPSLTYVDATAASTGPAVISIYSDGNTIYAAAALSRSGTCYYIKDVSTTGTTYGTGPGSACTGQDAATSAASPYWTDGRTDTSSMSGPPYGG